MACLRFSYFVAVALVGLLLIEPVEAQSLVHLWAFENNFNDTSGSGNHGTATGSPAFVTGQFGQGISLASTADGVNLDFGANNLPLGASASWAMNLWVNLTEAPGSLEYLAGFGIDDGFITDLDEGSTRALITVGENFYYWGGSADVNSGQIYESDSQWHMYTVSYDGTDLSMYKDGAFIGAATPGPLPFTEAFDEIHVGNPSNWNSEFDGSLDEFAIFNGALSDSQVGGLYFNNDINNPVVLEPTLTVNRDTGEIVFTNDSSFDIDVLGYTVRSASGALDPSSWDTIAGRFDAPPGDGSIDDDNWTVVTDTNLQYSVEFSEGVPGTDGGTIAIGKEVNFGSSWVKNPTEDIAIDLLLNDGNGTIRTVLATFTGNGDTPFAVGDLNGSGGLIDSDDWEVFRTAPDADLTGATAAQAYLGGDLDGDFDKDIQDYALFVSAYEADNGGGSFALLINAAPEPTAVFLLLPAGLLVAPVVRRRKQRGVSLPTALLAAGLLMTTNTASADLWGYYPLNGNADNQATNTNTNLVLVGGAGFAGSVHPGLGSAISLDGVDDGAVGENFNKFVTNDVTVAAWVYADDLDSVWDTIVKNWGTGVGGQFHFGLGTADANTLQNFVAATPNNVTDDIDLPVGEWVHTAFVLDSTANEHRLYINGEVAATGGYDGVLGAGTATGLGIGAKPNDDGAGLDASGAAGPWDGRIDDVALFNEAMSTVQIDQIYQNGLVGIQADGTTLPFIRLIVDRASGDVTILNDSPAAVSINAYQVGSVSGALRPAELDDLAGNTGFPTGSGTGNGWELDGANDATQLLETYLTGNSTFSIGGISIGDIFTPGGAEDLTFTYRTADGSVVDSIIEYTGVAPAGLVGDYNNDGAVDSVDYALWRENLGMPFSLMNRDPSNSGDVSQADFESWLANYGAMSPSAGGVSPVPEPATLGLLCLLCLPLASTGRRRG